MTNFADTSVTAAKSSPNAPSGTSRGGAWLNVVSHLLPRYGGISSAVPELASAVAEAGARPIAVAGFCFPGEFQVPAAYPSVQFSQVPFSRLTWYGEPAVRQAFRDQVGTAAGVHIHGLWDQSTNAAARTAFALGKPYLISAHGMLERWALQNKGLKKKIYLALFESTNLRRAACLHALTQAEAGDYRRLGLRNPIAVIPNGVRVPAYSSGAPFLSRYPALRAKRIVLFLGRIHFKKGLDILCEAWARMCSQWPDAQLVLAGPDFEGTRPQIEQLVRTLHVEDRITFTGMLSGELKWSALAAASCFILPSYSEGLSVSVLEAMGMGLPVIITEQCNLPEVSGYGCGWVTQPTADAVERALLEFGNSSPAAIVEMGTNGRNLVAARYSWPVIGKQMSELYSWVEASGGADWQVGKAKLPGGVDLQLFGEPRP